MLLEPCAHCPALPLCPFLITDMVRTRGGSRLRPPVRFSTPEQEEQPQFQLQSLSQSLRSLRGSGGTRPGWDPGPLPQCLRGDPRGPDPLSGPVHQDQGSHRHPGLNHHSPRQQQRPAHRPIFRLLRGSDDLYLLGPRYRGTSICAPETFMESHTTTCRH